MLDLLCQALLEHANLSTTSGGTRSTFPAVWTALESQIKYRYVLLSELQFCHLYQNLVVIVGQGLGRFFKTSMVVAVQ